MTKATYPKTAQQMFDDLAGIEEGGSLYTLKRTEPFTVEYIERVSRSSKTSPDESKSRTTVYLSTARGKEYRMVIECESGRVAMEHVRDGSWVTYSNDLSRFRHRSPSRPEHGESWPCDKL